MALLPMTPRGEDPAFQLWVGGQQSLGKLVELAPCWTGLPHLRTGSQQSKGMINRKSFRFCLKLWKVIIWVAQEVSLKKKKHKKT